MTRHNLESELLREADRRTARGTCRQTTAAAGRYRPDRHGRPKPIRSFSTYEVADVALICSWTVLLETERRQILDAGQQIAALLEELRAGHPAADAALAVWERITSAVYADHR